ncbi:MAG TPA: hypothetical protein HPQ00_11700 [Magnetococcales bacterium]|nr:hypothetical protein [Magnetococcales bacterium]
MLVLEDSADWAALCRNVSKASVSISPVKFTVFFISVMVLAMTLAANISRLLP